MNGRMRWLRQRTIVLAVAAIAVVALGGTALAGHIGSDVKSYTGCLVSGEGVIIKIKEGDAPKSACSGGQSLVHLSGGDITSVAVQAGGGLTGGGTNGAVNLSLRRDCGNSDVLKWNGSAWTCAADSNSTYTAGTGLDLTGSEFSIEPAYRLPGKSCTASGELARGFDSNGVIQCQAPAAAALPWVQGSFEAGGIPDDEEWHVFASVGTTPGTWAVIAKGTVTSEENVDQFKGAECRVQHGGTEVDSIGVLISNHLNSVPRTPFALTGIRTVTSGSFELACRANDGADGVGLAVGRIVALRIG